MRGITDQLDFAARERLRQANLDLLRLREIQSLEVTVLYAMAQK